MTYDTDYIPTTAEALRDTLYIARWEDDESDGTAGTYDERDYDDYERRVLAALVGNWTTDHDEIGVYLVRDEATVE